jgi:hypothetical protein
VREYYEASSEGYSKLSLSKALCRYISLPITSDQSAQLVPGLGSNSKPSFVDLSILAFHSVMLRFSLARGHGE